VTVDPTAGRAARLCILGPSGRMGQMLIAGAAGRADVAVVSAVDRVGSPLIGREVAPGIEATANLETGLEAVDAYIDFTTPDATAQVAALATERRLAGVIGTTGLGPASEAAIDALARVAPVVVAANFSLGVNLLIGLARQAARALGPDFDTEVVEIHHKLKRDAPSGTAIALAKALAASREADYDAIKRYAREGEVGARPPGEIGIVAVRGGDVIGDHTIHFLGPDERIELTHRAGNRRIFAAGALRAAAWVVGKPPGRYDMLDVLSLR
jgi:4-hydroxy-tetrahydrodipicolinate reductase